MAETSKKGGDGKINMDQLRELDKRLGGVKEDKKALKKFLETKPKADRPSSHRSSPS